jgi:D-3-phosphoglycerate dehydrogenase
VNTHEGFRIFITGNSIGYEAIAFLREENCLYVFAGEDDDSSSLTAKIREFEPDGLVVRKGRIDEKVLRASPRLRAVCKHGVGVDNIDVEAASRMHIPVMITAAANCESVAEHALGLLLGLLRAIPVQDRYTRRGGWDKTNYQGEDLFGRSVGIVGLGRIGKRFSQLLTPFETEIFGYDPYLSELTVVPMVKRVTRLRDMLPSLDILSIHCPLTPETAGLIGGEEFSAMKEGSWLVNTARGKIVDESELVKSLESGRLRGAALDTLETEPPDRNCPLLAMDNVIITNHIAGSSSAALAKMSLSSVRLVVNALQGIFPDRSHLVNPDTLDQVV